MSTSTSIKLRARLRWWFMPWLYAVVTLQHFTGWVPKASTREAIIKRGIYVEIAT